MTAGAGELIAYRDGAAWTRGPQPVYDRLACAALAHLPARLDGIRALDVGAGTGAAARELLARGADVVALDTSPSMLAELSRQTAGRIPTIVGDIRGLGVPDDDYDIAVATFVINHLADPVSGVRELARVTRGGGKVVATTSGADDHPIKSAVDDLLLQYGFEHPSWYLTLKRDRIPLIAQPDALARVGADAGLADVSVAQLTVDLADLPLEAAVAYRLGLAHIAPFVAGLDTATRARLHTDLVACVTGLPPLRLAMLVLTGRS